MNGVSVAGALHALVCLQLRSGVEPGGFECTPARRGRRRLGVAAGRRL